MNKYRYERKFFIENTSLSSVEMIVKSNPLMFSEIYHSRYINNIYCDTPGLTNYYDNVNGNLNRHKIRIRWYNKLLSKKINSKLEIKVKKGDLGEKLSYEINDFLIYKNQKISDIQKFIMQTKIGDQYSINNTAPTLINRYKRKYFLSFNKKFRVTIDNDLSFYSINKEYLSMIKKYHDGTSVILELKYLADQDDYAREVTNRFPFRITKSSKYVIGMDNI
jgi:hypothetical protein